MPVFIYQTEIPNAIPHIRDTYIACKKSSDIDIKKYYHCNDLQLLSVTELHQKRKINGYFIPDQMISLGIMSIK